METAVVTRSGDGNDVLIQEGISGGGFEKKKKKVVDWIFAV